MSGPEHAGPEHFNAESFFYWENIEQQLNEFISTFVQCLAYEGIGVGGLIPRLCLDKVREARRSQMLWDGEQVIPGDMSSPHIKKQLQAEVAFLFTNNNSGAAWLRVINTLFGGPPLNADSEADAALLQQGYMDATAQLTGIKERASGFIAYTQDYLHNYLGRRQEDSGLGEGAKPMFTAMVELYAIHSSLSPQARASATEELRLRIGSAHLNDRQPWLELLDQLFVMPYAPPMHGQTAGPG